MKILEQDRRGLVQRVTAWLTAWLCAACLVIAGVLADEPPKEIELTEAQLFAYIRSLASPNVPRINAVVGQLMAAGETAGDPKAQQEIMSKLREAQDDFARSVGFGSYREYADVGHTFSLLTARQTSPSSGTSAWEQEIDKAIAAVESNQDMSDQQKKELIASMRSVAAKIKQPLMVKNVELYRRLKPRIDEATADVDRILGQREALEMRPSQTK